MEYYPPLHPPDRGDVRGVESQLKIGSSAKQSLNLGNKNYVSRNLFKK